MQPGNCHKGQNTILGLKLDQIQLLPNKEIRSDTVKFQVIGHAVLRGSDGYLDNTDAAQIEEAINTHLQTKLNFLNQKITLLDDILYSPIKLVEHQNLLKVLPTLRRKITSIRGNITLSGIQPVFNSYTIMA